jgi:diguanylate cyclase (GGDEF)-like protein
MPRSRSIYEDPTPAKVKRGQLTLESFEAPVHAAEVTVKRARYLALHDALTLLPNRQFLSARLEQAIGRTNPPQQSLALLHLSINLEDFKPSIDAYGVGAGDELLARIAARLTSAPRAEDMLCHLERDQFACLVPGVPQRERLGELANQLLDAVPFPLRIGILQLCVRPSIGIALYPADGAGAQALMANAEFAMRRAKRRDANFTFADEA